MTDERELREKIGETIEFTNDGEIDITKTVEFVLSLLPASPQPATEGEWVRVPREPTADMLAAGDEALVDTASNYDNDWIVHARNAYRAMLSASPQPDDGWGELRAYQANINDWMLQCFGEVIAADDAERCDRFLEEALELVQARGYPKERVAALTDYTFSRPAGETAQEVGGVMVCLAALCTAAGVSLEEAAEAERARIWTLMDKIRAKQASKPKAVVSSRWGGSPLPVPPPPSGLELEANARKDPAP